MKENLETPAKKKPAVCFSCIVGRNS